MISIIMPIYNSEKYLENAIKSVLAQTYKEFELILVNDGSRDGSWDICQKYAETDKRIRTINKQNGGICSARNAGLQIAKGEYIGFIDNDDLFTESLLEDNYKLAVKYNADLVRFGMWGLNSEDDLIKVKEAKPISGNDVIWFDCIEARKSYYSFRQKYLKNVWNGLYKRTVINENNIKFNEFYRYGFEDWMFNVEFFFGAQKVIYNPQNYYIHFARLNYSTSLSYNFNRVESFMDGAQRELALCRDNCISVLDTAKMLSFYVTMILRELWGKDDCLSFKEKKELIASLGYEQHLDYFKRFRPIFLKEEKRVSILTYLYLHKRYRIQWFVVKLWKLKCRLRKRYF